MKEGKLEKLNIEKTVLERLKEIKAKEEKNKKENPTYGSPWFIISPEKLIPEAQEVFDLFEKEELLPAREKLAALKEKIEKMKKGDEKISNENFLSWIDDKIETKFLNRQLKEEQEKDNRR